MYPSSHAALPSSHYPSVIDIIIILFILSSVVMTANPRARLKRNGELLEEEEEEDNPSLFSPFFQYLWMYVKYTRVLADGHVRSEVTRKLITKRVLSWEIT